MKRTDLLRSLAAIAREKNWELVKVREGGNHTIYRIGATPITVGRHTEIPEGTAAKILGQARKAAPKPQD